MVPLEERILELRRENPTITPLLGAKVLLQPILRLRSKLQSDPQQPLLQYVRQQPRQLHQQRLQSARTTEVSQLPSPLSMSIRDFDSRPSTPDVSTSAIHAAYRRRSGDVGDRNVARPMTANAADSSSQYGDYSQFKANEFKFLKVGGRQHEGYSKVVPPHLQMREDLQSVGDVLQEWRYGFEGQPSIQENNSKYGGRWRNNQKNLYVMRSLVIEEFIHLVKEYGMSSLQAVQRLAHIQGSQTVTKLGREVKKLRYERKHGRPNDSA